MQIRPRTHAGELCKEGHARHHKKPPSLVMSIDTISDQCLTYYTKLLILTGHSSSTKTVLFLLEYLLQTLSTPSGLQDD